MQPQIIIYKYTNREKVYVELLHHGFCKIQKYGNASCGFTTADNVVNVPIKGYGGVPYHSVNRLLKK